jgi:sugar phosphate isomerase/epimerase
MRVGVLINADFALLDSLRDWGFRSLEWVAFDQSPAAQETDWQRFATEFSEAARERGLRISAIGALYRNPLDPAQREFAQRIFRRALDVAELIGVKTVAGFPGAVIETEVNERGGNVRYKPFENYLPRLIEFWEPLARVAADKGLRLAFEHCPQGVYHLPIMGYNMLGQPAMWERLFNATTCDNIGLEWDASHLLCQFIDPVENIHRFGHRIFHVHAKDAFINRKLLSTYGICHAGVAEHRFPGVGEANWAEIVHALLRCGYDSDLNIEGWHDPVYRDHGEHAIPGLNHRKLERTGLLIARDTLQKFTQGTE